MYDEKLHFHFFSESEHNETSKYHKEYILKIQSVQWSRGSFIESYLEIGYDEMRFRFLSYTENLWLL